MESLENHSTAGEESGKVTPYPHYCLSLLQSSNSSS
uniref:Uncharacterized protein n=1 Tax=Arundo donax TaxID=35708 RepID=A0A0A9BYB4_ARUDO